MKTIAIIGGGPAGCTAGILLVKKGFRIGIFQNNIRPDLIVGESLLPSIIPILEELGVDEEVKSFSTYKPGATFCLSEKEILEFDFGLAKGKWKYAYNTPRDKFDKCLQNAAKKAGCRFFELHAKVELCENNLPKISKETLQKCDGFFEKGIDFIIDASGRSRVLPRLLNLPATHGKRKDKALFAHLKTAKIENKGHIHVDRYPKGWGWRIPLPDRVSVGIVVAQKHLLDFGKTSEEQFDNFLKAEPILANSANPTHRLTKVMTYSNYQWKCESLVGENWMLIGDSAGFIDPVFSTGLHLSMYSAKKAVNALVKQSKSALSKYETYQKNQLESWQMLIDYWYSGKLFSLFRSGEHLKDSVIGRILNPHMTKHITRIFTGEANHKSYSSYLLRFMTENGIRDVNIDDLEIK